MWGLSLVVLLAVGADSIGYYAHGNDPCKNACQDIRALLLGDSCLLVGIIEIAGTLPAHLPRTVGRIDDIFKVADGLLPLLRLVVADTSRKIVAGGRAALDDTRVGLDGLLIVAGTLVVLSLHEVGVGGRRGQGRAAIAAATIVIIVYDIDEGASIIVPDVRITAVQLIFCHTVFASYRGRCLTTLHAMGHRTLSTDSHCRQHQP